MKQKNDRAAGWPGFAIKDSETPCLGGLVTDDFLAESMERVHTHCQASDFPEQIHAALRTASVSSSRRDSVAV
jgi:hypothetical protein